MRHLFLLLITTLIINNAIAQKQEHYSRAKISLDNQGHTLNDLAALGLAVDHGEGKKNFFFISDFSDRELDLARKAGFKVEVLIGDVVKHYQQQNKKKAKKTTSVSCNNTDAVEVPAHFHLGGYAGGYFDYTEMLAIIDSMQLLYPGLISLRQPISTFTSIEGRPIYWVRISNNPSVDQPAKPQMLVTALHHAREPGSLSAVIFYMWHLLEHYSTDPHIKTIIDNTELYFVPCVNPDGYVYNSTYYSAGGGMWRKNRRDNLDGTEGIDLNRNYGYFWGYDNIGSSPMTSSDTYRGPFGFSEPETQAIKWFAENHNFRLNLNFHTYHNDILYPWGHVPNLLTVDSSIFFNFGTFLTQHNHYRFGTCNQVLNYISNGASDDWMYGDVSAKNKVFAFTPEVGANYYGFYPPTGQIIPDCQANLQENINCASLLLPFAQIQHEDKKILVNSSGYLHYSVKRLGFPDTATFTASVIPLDSWMTTATTSHVYTVLTMLQQVQDSFSYSLLPSTPNGQLISYVLKLNNGFYDIYDTVRFYYGKHYSSSTPSTSSLADWINSGWGICSSSYFSAPSSIQSSATGNDNYPDDANLTLSTVTPADLTYSTHAYLQFHAKWGIETDFDSLVVSASIDGSGYWTPLCGLYTKFTHDYPVYDGQQPFWVREEMNLGDFLGEKINIQFELASDAGANDKGYFIDDVSITTVQDTPSFVRNAQPIGVNLALYPNPARGQLMISVTGNSLNQPIDAVLYDCLGREAMSFTLTQSETAIDVHRLPANVYYLKASESGRLLSMQKVVISR
jgi:carboxypeptidase T